MTESEADYWGLAKLRRHYVLILICLAVGLLAGIVAGLVTPATYTAEVRLAVGTGTVSDLNVPGYPTASADMAANYARWVEVKGLAGMGAPPGTTEIQASPFPQSNVIRIEAMSRTAAVAKRAADQVAAKLEHEVNAAAEANDTQGILQQASQQDRAATAAELDMTFAKDALDNAIKNGLATADLRSKYLDASTTAARARLVANGLEDRYRRLVSTATTETALTRVGAGPTITGNSKHSTIERYGLVGLGGGLVAALLLIRVLGPALVRRREQR